LLPKSQQYVSLLEGNNEVNDHRTFLCSAIDQNQQEIAYTENLLQLVSLLFFRLA